MERRISYILGAALPTDSEDNSSYTIRIDIHDVFDDQGNYRDLDKTLATFVHEYGHVLTLNNEQVDLSKLTQQKSYYTPEAYRDGSYIKAFYDRFWNVEAGELSYYQHPDRYVNEYASQNVTEDIAESFMVFVLDGKQPGQSLAAQKINFFYQYPELVAVRDSIRRNFHYPVEP